MNKPFVEGLQSVKGLEIGTTAVFVRKKSYIYLNSGSKIYRKSVMEDTYGNLC